MLQSVSKNTTSETQKPKFGLWDAKIYLLLSQSVAAVNGFLYD